MGWMWMKVKMKLVYLQWNNSNIYRDTSLWLFRHKRLQCRHHENFWALTGPSPILQILNVIIHKSFTCPIPVFISRFPRTRKCNNVYTIRQKALHCGCFVVIWQWLICLAYPFTLRPRQNGRHFADIFKCIFLNENVWILIKISLKFVPQGPINNIPALVQIMAWCRPGDKPLSEPMLVGLPTHICVTRPQWVKGNFTGMDNVKTAAVSMKQPWRIWVNHSHESLGADIITMTKHLARQNCGHISWHISMLVGNPIP